MIYSLTDPSWNFLPEFLDEINLKNGPLIRDNTIIILPKGKKMKHPLVLDPELMSTMRESERFTVDSTDPVMITIPTEYKDLFNREGVSSAFCNNVAANVAKATISARFDPNKLKTNLTDVLHSQSSIIPLIEFNVIPDDDLSFISKDTKEANDRSSFFFFFLHL